MAVKSPAVQSIRLSWPAPAPILQNTGPIELSVRAGPCARSRVGGRLAVLPRETAEAAEEHVAPRTADHQVVAVAADQDQTAALPPGVCSTARGRSGGEQHMAVARGAGHKGGVRG